LHAWGLGGRSHTVSQITAARSDLRNASQCPRLPRPQPQPTHAWLPPEPSRALRGTGHRTTMMYIEADAAAQYSGYGAAGAAGAGGGAEAEAEGWFGELLAAPVDPHYQEPVSVTHCVRVGHAAWCVQRTRLRAALRLNPPCLAILRLVTLTRRPRQVTVVQFDQQHELLWAGVCALGAQAGVAATCNCTRPRTHTHTHTHTRAHGHSI
jgi:hypothetical protein